MAREEPQRTGRRDGSTAPPLAEPGEADVRDPLPREVRDPSFPASVRGYDRRVVDRYVEHVNRLIAELQVSGSPRAAVRHALDRVGEQTSSILQRARDTAEEITGSAREEAQQTTDRARAEAAEIEATARQRAEEVVARANGEAQDAVARARVDVEGRVRRAEEEIAGLRADAERHMHALRADIAAVSDERRRLLDGVRQIARRMEELVAQAREPDEREPAAEGEHRREPAEAAGSGDGGEPQGHGPEPPAAP